MEADANFMQSKISLMQKHQVESNAVEAVPRRNAAPIIVERRRPGSFSRNCKNLER